MHLLLIIILLDSLIKENKLELGIKKKNHTQKLAICPLANWVEKAPNVSLLEVEMKGINVPAISEEPTKIKQENYLINGSKWKKIKQWSYRI